MRRATMFIGSSNLTDAALKKNYEYNLKLTSLENSFFYYKSTISSKK